MACDYCSGNRKLVDLVVRGNGAEIEIREDRLVLDASFGGGSFGCHQSLEIKFCPMCGEKLGVE